MATHYHIWDYRYDGAAGNKQRPLALVRGHEVYDTLPEANRVSGGRKREGGLASLVKNCPGDADECRKLSADDTAQAVIAAVTDGNAQPSTSAGGGAVSADYSELSGRLSGQRNLHYVNTYAQRRNARNANAGMRQGGAGTPSVKVVRR